MRWCCTVTQWCGSNFAHSPVEKNAGFWEECWTNHALVLAPALNWQLALLGGKRVSEILCWRCWRGEGNYKRCSKTPVLHVLHHSPSLLFHFLLAEVLQDCRSCMWIGSPVSRWRQFQVISGGQKANWAWCLMKIKWNAGIKKNVKKKKAGSVIWKMQRWMRSVHVHYRKSLGL